MKDLFHIVLLITTTFFGCRSSTYTASKPPPSQFSSYQKVEFGDFYFPLKSEDVREDVNGMLDSFQNKWYSEHLYSLNEPILFKNIGINLKVFRFTKLPTWGNPVTYRIEKSDSTVLITKRITNGHGGYFTGKIITDETKQLNRKEWNALIEQIQSIEFWHQNTHGKRGLDGEEWILEGLENDQYHVVVRWSPDQYGDKKFVNTCKLFEVLFNKNG